MSDSSDRKDIRTFAGAVGAQGRVTIPGSEREDLGLDQGDYVAVSIRPVTPPADPEVDDE